MTQKHLSLIASRTSAWPPGSAVVLGIDPGDTCGVVLAAWFPAEEGRRRQQALITAFSVDGLSAPGLISMLLRGYGDLITCAATEEFVVRRRASRLSGTVPSMTTELLSVAESMCAAHQVPVKRRTASLVKGWATDERLQAAGFAEATSKMTDARDAARHALYCAVKDCGVRDPLSAKAGEPA